MAGRDQGSNHLLLWSGATLSILQLSHSPVRWALYPPVYRGWPRLSKVRAFAPSLPLVGAELASKPKSV